jgi:hypothetical protein
MDEIISQERDLFTEWKGTQPNEKFICDGIVDVPTFESQIYRIVFVLKETNQLGDDYDASLVKFVKDGAPGNGGHTWNPVCKWLTGINKIFTQAERKDILKAIAVVNLKKEDGGNKTDLKTLRERVARDKEFLKRQIGIYIKHDPVVFVCCGPWLLSMLKNTVLPLFSDCDGLDIITSDSLKYIKPYLYRKVYFVAFSHPNCRESSATLINEFKKIKALCIA